MELQTVIDPAPGTDGAAKQRALDVLANGGGWKSFGLRSQDIVRTWADLAEAGLELTPPLGQATRDSDGSYYRWWVAGQGEAFRAGRLPNLVEYESDPYRYQQTPAAPESGALIGVASVDIAVPELAQAVPDYTILLGGPPLPGRDDDAHAHTAKWTLPDGRHLRLLAPEGGAGPLARHLRQHGQGVCSVAFTTSDLPLTTARLAKHGGQTTATSTGELLITAPASLALRITLCGQPANDSSTSRRRS